MRRASVLLVAVLLWLPLGSMKDAYAATDPTSLPFAILYDMVIDAHGHVFVSGGPGTSSVAVIDPDGRLSKEIPVAGAAGMEIVGDDLFVSAADAPNVTVIDTQALTVARTISVGRFTQPHDLAYAGGRLWFFASTATGSVVVGVDPDGTGLTRGYTVAASYDPRFVEGLAGGNSLYMFDRGLSPMSMYGYDVSLGRPARLHQIFAVADAANGTEAALLPDDGGIMLAAGGSGGFPQVRASDYATLRTYVADVYPTAVAVTAARGGLIAGGENGIYTTDVWTYRVGQTQSFWQYDFGSSEITVVAGGLVWSNDGSALFAVTTSTSTTTGDLILTVFHPFEEPAVPSAQPTLAPVPTIAPQPPGVPAPAPVPGVATARRISGGLLAMIVLLGAALGLGVAFAAKEKGYSFGLWWFLGFLSFAISLIVLLLLPRKTPKRGEDPRLEPPLPPGGEYPPLPPPPLPATPRTPDTVP